MGFIDLLGDFSKVVDFFNQQKSGVFLLLIFTFLYLVYVFFNGSRKKISFSIEVGNSASDGKRKADKK